MVKIIFLGVLVALQSFALSNEELRKNEEAKKKLLAESALHCGNARSDLETYIGQLPNACKKTEECSAHYIKVSSCESPITLNKTYKSEKDKKLLQLQNEVRQHCKEELLHQPICSAIAIIPVCYKGKCVPNSQVPIVAPVITEQDLKAKFKYAVKRDGCAPDDSPAWNFIFNNRKVSCDVSRRTYPMIFAMISGELPTIPMQSPKKYSAKMGDMKIHATYCKAEKSCVSGEQTDIEIKSLDANKGTGSLILTLPDGRKMETDFEFEDCKDQQMMCG